ncbi:hypothetical protein C2G38_2179178 [Gigaspora rosea]|uniref:Uncharacterized protein n=1 Tax=Gigaspora rosea TaxID=44941 RepID=A0A397VDI8_9GLOM|nr:hypothetical protein C2G38_2179178 [Gigaspora rosea]
MATQCWEFAPRLRSLSQEVLDGIKFLTQECGLGTKAQYQYLSKKFPIQPLYNSDMVNWLMQQKEQELGWAVFIELEGWQSNC